MKISTKMWSKIPSIILILLIMGLTITLLIRDKKELIIITKNTIYSKYHTDGLEKITLEMLTNKQEDYHFDVDYVSSAKIWNDEEEIAIQILEFKRGNESIIHNNDKYYIINTIFQLGFEVQDTIIQIEEAKIQINYLNGTSIQLEIGEFNYMFSSSQSNDITFSHLSATHETVFSMNTIGGINIELNNLSDYNIQIQAIDILSNKLKFHTGQQLEEECDFQKTVKECLNTDFYSFTYPNANQNSFFIGKNNSILLYLPLIYNTEYRFVYTFTIIITYEVNGSVKTYVIDDFPYIRTSSFQILEEGYYHEEIIQYNDN